MQRSVSPAPVAAITAAVLFVAAVLGYGALFPAFSQLQHPVAALGASGVPHALAFNLIGFVLPGLLAAFAAQTLRGRMGDAPYVARLGVQALTLAAVAFAALGLMPLDSGDLLSSASRLHAATWTFWWVAVVVGATLLGLGMRGTRHAPRSWAVTACALVTLLFAIILPGVIPVGLSQRIAFAAWFAATYLMAPSRAAASTSGSSPTGPT
ncbi:DUF998 domain-containing protein [Lysobacter sp. TY2-98]|uniref:DUF998 domain-containing protein n=1 Tax=Lysobacter sp. TY2-98 TaxID=2290922 RepID=UPI000E200109|nr:DUF998 domain-containing protein [Lysobacter sp. TY2-98]AXK71547.1 DUF998 domain-containing protein [Lysobacter sp. TY2-98]